MEHYISFALKQQSPGHQCKVLEGQPYIMQDNCFHFLSSLLYQGWVKLFYILFKKESQIQNIWPAFKDELLSITLYFMKMLFQIILLFECSASLWAGILLSTIMEQYMLCACSETKGIQLFPSWSITYLVLWNNKLLDMHVKFWKDNLK